MKDVAQVSLSSEELESTYQYNGEDAIAIMVTKKSDANTVDVVERIKSKLDILRDTYPYIQFELAQDGLHIYKSNDRKHCGRVWPLPYCLQW